MLLAMLMLPVAALIFMGATYSPRTVDVVVQPGVSYNFLANPQFMGADSNFLYIVDGDELVIVRRSTAITERRFPINNGQSNFTPIYMTISNDFMFLFSNTGYFVFSIPSLHELGNGTPLMGQSINASYIPNPILPNRALPLLLQRPLVFDVVHLTDTTFHILSAYRNRHSSQQVTVHSSSVTHGTASVTEINANQMIHGIAVGSGGAIHLLASAPLLDYFFIYRAGQTTPIHSQGDFIRPHSFNYVDNGFVFITGEQHSRIMFLDTSVTPHEFGYVLASTDALRIHESFEPISTFILPSGDARSDIEVFVIDARKASIDIYQVGEATITIRPNSPAIASRSGDGGFFNSPSAMALIGEDRFLVGDVSDSVKLVDRNTNNPPQSFVSARGPNDYISIPQAIAFNNHQLIYIYDWDGRIQRFDMDGRAVGTPIPMGGMVTQLIPDPSTQLIYALNAEGLTGRIYRSSGASFAQLEPATAVTISTLTRGVVSSHHNHLFLVNANAIGAATRHVAINLRYPHAVTDITAQINFATAGVTPHDITVDTLGNLLIMGRGSNNRLYLNQFILSPSFNTTLGYSHDIFLNGATAGPNPSLSFDRLNNKLLWVGANHAIEGIYLRGTTDPWGFRYDWTNGNFNNRAHYNFREATPIAQPTADRPLFGRVFGSEELEQRNLRAPLLFSYPNSIRPITQLSPNTRFMIMQHDATFGPHVFGYSKVLVGTTVGYLNHRFMQEPAPAYSRTDNVFDSPTAPNLTNSGRVVVNGLVILKYPTSANIGVGNRYIPASTVNGAARTLNKNFNADGRVNGEGTQGLHILRRITVPDSRGWEFYEILLDAEGNPNPNPAPGEPVFSGFVFTGYVINWMEYPSQAAFVPNARITIPSSYSPRLVPVYSRPSFDAVRPGEMLSHDQRVRIVGNFDRSRPFTRIIYFDEELGRTVEGYVETRYIAPDSMSPWIIVGIVIAGLGLIGVIVFTVMHFRRKRAQL